MTFILSLSAAPMTFIPSLSGAPMTFIPSLSGAPMPFIPSLSGAPMTHFLYEGKHFTHAALIKNVSIVYINENLIFYPSLPN